MLLKWLVLSLVVYFIYRNFIAPPKIDKGRTQDRQQLRNDQKAENDENEYIDYEEVD